MILVVFNYL